MTELTIRDLADEFGLTLRALRFWEDRKILKPTRRGHERIYTAADRDVVRDIIAWSDAGFTLFEIRELQELRPADRAPLLRLRLPGMKAEAERSHARKLAAIATLLDLAVEDRAA